MKPINSVSWGCLSSGRDRHSSGEMGISWASVGRTPSPDPAPAMAIYWLCFWESGEPWFPSLGYSPIWGVCGMGRTQSCPEGLWDGNYRQGEAPLPTQSPANTLSIHRAKGVNKMKFRNWWLSDMDDDKAIGNLGAKADYYPALKTDSTS